MRPGDVRAGNLDQHQEDAFSEAVPMSFSGRVLAHLMMSVLGGLELWSCYKTLPRVMACGKDHAAMGGMHLMVQVNSDDDEASGSNPELIFLHT